MTTLIDHIEAEAKANAAFHIANAEVLSKEANTLLSLLLAGAGGLATYAVTLVGKGVPSWQWWGLAVASAYLFLVSAVTLLMCLRARPIWPPANEPKNFPTSGFNLDDLRQADLENRQNCIDYNRSRNDDIGMWLNRCRLMAAAVPLVVVIGVAIILRIGQA